MGGGGEVNMSTVHETTTYHPLIFYYYVLTLLRFASEKIGWDQIKVDSSLLPVLKRMNARTSHQQPITHYLPRALPDVGPLQRKGIKSRRIRNVVARLTNTGQHVEWYTDLPTRHIREELVLQWNLYIADTIGELHVGRYRGPAVAEGLYKYYMNEIRT